MPLNKSLETSKDSAWKYLREIVEDLAQKVILEDYAARERFVRNFRIGVKKGSFDAILTGENFDLMDFRIKVRNGTCAEDMIVAITPKFEAWLAMKYLPKTIKIDDITNGTVDFYDVLKRQRDNAKHKVGTGPKTAKQKSPS